MSDSAVIREYLVSLGFDIDKVGEKKATNALAGLDKQAIGLGKAVVGVSAAVTSMVTVFAYQMEKMYYSSLKTNSTVGSLQALEYGAKQIGLSGDQMRSSLEGMSRALRTNPGLNGLLGHMGINAAGRENSEVFMDLLTKLKQMPFFVASKFGAMFGIGSDELFLLLNQLDELKAKQEERRRMAKEVGVDTEKAARDSREYANAIRGVEERLGLLGSAVLSKLLPSFVSFTQGLNENLDTLTKWISKYESLQDAIDALLDRRDKKTGAFTRRKPKNVMDFLLMSPLEVASGKEAAAKPVADPKGMLTSLEKKYALPTGLMDRVWAAESNRSDPRFMNSKAGAMGPFQFMPKTAKEYGVNNPYDFAESADAAAHKYADLLKQYKGNLGMAAAAYNYGQGNLASKGIENVYQLGRAPVETQGYVSKVAPQVTQQNTITLQGGDRGTEIQRMLLETMRVNNADLVRQMNVRTR